MNSTEWQRLKHDYARPLRRSPWERANDVADHIYVSTSLCVLVFLLGVVVGVML